MAKRGKATRKAKAKANKPATKPAKATKPKKRRLSQTPEAKRARAYRKALKLEQRAAELAAAARRERRRARRLELESIALGEAERKRAERDKRKRRAAGDERQVFADALEYMRNTGSVYVPLSLELTEAEVGARIPWLVVGRFDCVEAPTYAELDAVFRDWEADIALETRIHAQRMSQIRIVYNDPNAKRGEGDSIVSHIGAWEVVISEIAFELDPDEEGSLGERYANTTVSHFYVYFSSGLASEAEIDLASINERIFGKPGR